MDKIKENAQVKREMNASHTMDPKYHAIEKVTNLENLVAIFRRNLDSLKGSAGYDLVQDMPRGSITIRFLEKDSVAVELGYNLDCQCPLEANLFDYLCMSVDINGSSGEPSISEVYLYEHIPKEGYFGFNRNKSGNEKEKRSPSVPLTQ